MPYYVQFGSVPMIIVGGVFMAFAWVTLALRYYVRYFMVKSLGWDDWLMLIATLLFTAFASVVIAVARIEMTWNILSVEFAMEVTDLIPIAFVLYIVATLFVKISLAVFFLRIIVFRWQRYIVIGSVVVYGLFSVAFFFMTLFNCGNPAHYYENEKAHKCLSWKESLGPMTYTHSALNAIVDWVFVAIPVYMVANAQMNKRARMSVIAILFLGIAGSVCSVARLGYVNLLGVGSASILERAPKFANLSMAELGLAIAAACLATLRPLFSKILGLTERYGYTARPRRTRATGRQTGGTAMSQHHYVHENQKDDAEEKSTHSANADTELEAGEQKNGILVVAEVMVGSAERDPEDPRDNFNRMSHISNRTNQA